MTKNAFIFSWDSNGLESLVPITKYEHWDKTNLMKILKNEKIERNPLDSIIRSLILRARINSHRNYEIYAVDCDLSLNEEFWTDQWKNDPESTAKLVREQGHKLF